ncbi:hypothetical protein AKJ16_DCAP06469 [Drosera capensis]
MFKLARWRSEKIKVNALFRFRFHATQVSRLEGNALVLSVVPAENGKPTAKLERSTVLDGVCRWENLVSETVKIVKDLKSGRIQERLYYFLVLMGSGNRSSLVGEVSINMAEYAEATKAALVSLPFKYSDSEGILHVSIQRIQENVEQRDEANHNAIEKSLKRYLSNGEAEVCANSNSAEEMPLRKKVSQIAGLIADRRASSGSDITLSSSESSYGLDTPRQQSGTNNSVHNGATASDDQGRQRTEWDWSPLPALTSCTDESLSSPADFFRSGKSQLALDDSVEKLRSSFVILARKAELADLELQSLRKQIVKESKRGQDLSREVADLREERDAVKQEYEQLKASQKWGNEMKLRSRLNFEGDPWALLEEIRQEMNFEKDLNANLRLQLQRMQESNSELMLAVQDMEQMFQQSKSDPSVKLSMSMVPEQLEETIPLCLSDEDEEQKALEELVKQHTDAKEVHLLEQRIMDLCGEIEIYRRDKDELEMQMEQLALDYEILKQENHDMSYQLGQSQIHDQLKLQYESSNSHPAQSEPDVVIEMLEIEPRNQVKELSDSQVLVKELETHINSLKIELEHRTQVLNAELQAVIHAKSDQEHKVDILEKELRKKAKKISDCLATIKELEAHVKRFEDEIENQGQAFEAELEAVTSAKLEQEFEMQKLEDELERYSKESSENMGTIMQLQTHVQDLEEELEKQARGFQADLQTIARRKLDQELKIEKFESELNKQLKECSDHLGVMKELEIHIRSLEVELDKQAQIFESDLEAVTLAKVEQEQRAIRAEEALRLMRWKNVNTTERLQEEFRRLSSQMQSSFEANEKLATNAMTEVSQLRLHNSHLEETLQKVINELQSVKDDYEAKVADLHDQIDMKKMELNQILVESQDKSKQLEHLSKHEDEVRKRLSEELAVLREDIMRLQADNLSLSQQAKQMLTLSAELEQKETMIEDMNLLVKRGNTEKENLECAVSSLKKEAEKSVEELNAMRYQCRGKEVALKDLQDKVDNLRVQCDDLRQSLYEDELENDRLRKLVVQLEAELLNKDDALAIMEGKLKDNNGRTTSAEHPKASPKTNKLESVPRGDKELTTLREKVKLLQGEIKLKETALEFSTNAFLKKEVDLRDKIKDLEIKLLELTRRGTALSANEVKKEGDCVDGSSEAETLSNLLCESMDHESSISPVDCNAEILPETQPTSAAREQQMDSLLQEVAILKEKNNSMETELKDMQERYSEISLKFAEVAGERQKLVMSLRNLKNSRKSS